MINENDWNIKPRAEKCSRCAAQFQDGRPYVSRLDFGADGYTRSDFCGDCWASESQTSGKGISVWQGTYRLPPPPPPEPIKRETAESLLKKLIASGDESKAEAIYILAVMLERKRLLVERGVQTREDGAKLRIYEHRKTGESYVVRDPMLKASDIARVQKQVSDLLAAPAPDQPAEPEQCSTSS